MRFQSGIEWETVETVEVLWGGGCTLLKQGVNEKHAKNGIWSCVFIWILGLRVMSDQEVGFGSSKSSRPRPVPQL